MNEKSIEIIVECVSSDIKSVCQDGLTNYRARLRDYLNNSLNDMLLSLGLKDFDAKYLTDEFGRRIKDKKGLLYWTDQFVSTHSPTPRTIASFFTDLENYLRNLINSEFNTGPFQDYFLGMQYELDENILDKIKNRNGRYQSFE